MGTSFWLERVFVPFAPLIFSYCCSREFIPKYGQSNKGATDSKVKATSFKRTPVALGFTEWWWGASWFPNFVFTTCSDDDWSFRYIIAYRCLSFPTGSNGFEQQTKSPEGQALFVDELDEEEHPARGNSICFGNFSSWSDVVWTGSDILATCPDICSYCNI